LQPVKRAPFFFPLPATRASGSGEKLFQRGHGSSSRRRRFLVLNGFTGWRTFKTVDTRQFKKKLFLPRDEKKVPSFAADEMNLLKNEKLNFLIVSYSSEDPTASTASGVLVVLGVGSGPFAIRRGAERTGRIRVSICSCYRKYNTSPSHRQQLTDRSSSFSSFSPPSSFPAELRVSVD